MIARLLTLAATIAALAAAPARAGDVLVFAASSLKTALDEAAQAYQAKTGQTVTLSYAATSALARQIEAGAPADLFVAASTDWMDTLAAGSLIAPDTRRDLLGNALVLVAPAPAAPLALADLPVRLGSGKLAMALVDAVPAGIYGKAALTSLGLWDTVAAQVAQTDNVRAALALVASGEAPFGVVYRTDALAEPRVATVADFPAASHAPIVYPAAAIAGRDSAEARALLDWLAGPEAGALFAAQGFTVLAE
ncbi:MAG: molybdate ABC transporter substrate-binding protein [Roseivivax sp.]|nr:molybdate ABC transporter substrate-binding protein [Roseivivax sp.]